MSLLRITLLLGMVIHKLVWEVLKKDSPAVPAEPKPARFELKSLVKWGKSAFLIFLLVQTIFLDLWPVSAQPAALQAAGLAIFLAGLALAVAARLQLGRNWANIEDYQVLTGQRLVRSGIYRLVRHPIYTGDLLLVLGLELALNSWLVLCVVPLAAVVARQTLAEEKILSRAFPEYREYQARSKMFIPFVI